MFIQLILLPLLLLFQLLSISGKIYLKFSFIYLFSFKLAEQTYDKYCDSDSNCNQHQKCLNKVCRCNIGERRFWTG